jgi:hypothetical protein
MDHHDSSDSTCRLQSFIDFLSPFLSRSIQTRPKPKIVEEQPCALYFLTQKPLNENNTIEAVLG